jgi:preprotein translocase subunit SecE
VLEHPTGRRGAVVDVSMILAFVIVIVVCLWLINRALKSKED